MRMRTVSKMTVVCILAILVVAFSSGRYSMVQAAPPVLSHNCKKVGNGLQCEVIEQSLEKAAADCRAIQADMKNDTADGFYAGLFRQMDCADTLARVA
jgi:hypothetical protein